MRLNCFRFFEGWEGKNILCYPSICVGNDLIGKNRLEEIHASSCLSGEEGEQISWKVAGHRAKNVMKF